MNAVIQCVRAKGLSSWVIARWGMQKPGFSHVDIVLPDDRLLGARDDTVRVKDMPAIPPGVRIRPANYAKWIRCERLSFEVDPNALRVAYDWAMGEVGQRYDDDAILGYICGENWHRRGAFICSVFGAKFLQHAGAIHDSETLEGISPNELYEMGLGAGASQEVLTTP